MKKIIKLFCTALFLFTCTTMSLAADPMDYKNAVGMYGMIYTDACGLQYQNWITHKVGLQLEGYATYDSFDYDYGEYEFSIAAQMLYNLFENPISEKTAINFYAWLLGEFKGYNELSYVDGAPNRFYDDSGFQTQYAVGLGFGFEFMFLKHLSIPLEFGYAGTICKKPVMGFVIGSGIRYRF